jgi:hypothetical protein
MEIVRSWEYEICETCLRNARKRVRMVKWIVVSGDAKGKHKKEMWICVECGSTRLL